MDGLGHGPEAGVAADAAVRYVSEHLDDRLDTLFAGCDSALRNTRGAAMGIVVVDSEAGMVTYAGVGNTRAFIYGDSRHRFSSDYGIVGAGYRRLVVERAPIGPRHLVVMSTDGLREGIELSGYESDVLSQPEILAGRVLEDWAQGHDDRGVLVFRLEDGK